MSDVHVVHELTMLYLQKKDVSDLSPAELFDEYKKVYAEIKERKAEKHDSGWTF